MVRNGALSVFVVVLLAACNAERERYVLFNDTAGTTSHRIQAIEGRDTAAASLRMNIGSVECAAEPTCFEGTPEEMRDLSMTLSADCTRMTLTDPFDARFIARSDKGGAVWERVSQQPSVVTAEQTRSLNSQFATLCPVRAAALAAGVEVPPVERETAPLASGSEFTDFSKVSTPELCTNMRRSLTIISCSGINESLINQEGGAERVATIGAALAQLKESCGPWPDWKTASTTVSQSVSRKLSESRSQLQSYSQEDVRSMCRQAASGYQF